MKGSIRRITELFDGSSKHLLIPVYQRNYDWSIKQCARLYDDLIDIVREDRKTHFFGAIVGHAETTFTYVVIDGQQRLTTTSLLMLALVHSLESGAVSSAEGDALAGRIRRSYLILEHEHGDVKFKLKPVKDDNDAYTRLLRGDQPIESSNVTANYRYFLDRIRRGDLDGDQIWTAISRLEVMALDLEDQDDPQRIFESINSTGLELSEADKIRNVVLMHLPSHQQSDLYENYWNRIEKSVEFRTDWFIRLYLVSKTSRMPRMDAVYETFRRYQNDSAATIQQILAEMRDYAEYSRKLNNAATGVPAADKRLRRFNLIKHDVTLPLTMPLLGEVERGTVTPDDFARTVEVIDSFVFRRFVCNVPTNALNKIFATAYSEVHRLRGDDDSFADVLVYLLRRRTTSGRFPTDEEFSEAFVTRDFYAAKSENRIYLFECLENNWSNDTHDIASALQNNAISIEHIMPQSLSQSWREELGPDADAIHATWLNRIGNLTVTGYNASYSNSTFTAKKRGDNGFDASPYRLNRLVRDSDEWTVKQLEERSHDLRQIAMKYWPLPTSSFVPYTPPLPTAPMGDDDAFTRRSVVAFEFQESRKTVKSWKEAMVSVLQLLLEDRREELFAYAETSNDFRVFADPQGIRDNESLVTPGLAVVSSTSTQAKMTLLRRLFDHLELDTDDLVFTLRGEAQADEPPAEEADGPYAELTKFSPELAEYTGSKAGPAETQALRTAFADAFAGFRDNDPQSTLPGALLPTLDTDEFISSATPHQIIAALTMMLQAEQFMPDQFHQRIVSGTVVRWLDRLES